MRKVRLRLRRGGEVAAFNDAATVVFDANRIEGRGISDGIMGGGSGHDWKRYNDQPGFSAFKKNRGGDIFMGFEKKIYKAVNQ